MPRPWIVVPHLARPDLAEVQVRGQPRGALHRGQVTGRGIPGDRLLQKPLQPLARPRLARRPFGCQAARPVDLRLQPELGDRRGVRPALGCLERGRRLRRWWIELRHAGPPERREHAVGLAGRRAHLPRLDQQRGVVAGRLEAGRPQLALDPPVAPLGGRLVQPVPVDAGGIDLGRQLAEHLERGPLAHHQPKPVTAEITLQGLQRTVEPPARCRARRPRLLLLGAPHEHRHHRPGRRGGGKRGVVGQPQVAAEPDDLRPRGYRLMPCTGRPSARHCQSVMVGKPSS